MLGGTRAAEGASRIEAEQAAERMRQVEAVELHELLHGDLDKAKIERVMTMLRRSMPANTALDQAYRRQYANASILGDCARLGSYNMARALNLFQGRAVEADAMVVSGNKARILEIDRKIAEAKDDDGPYAAMQVSILEKERKARVGELEQKAEESIAESRSDAVKQGADAAAVEKAAKTRAAAVLGDANELAGALGGTDAAVIRAMAADDPVAKAAAEIRKLEVSDDLKGKQLTAIMRGLRQQAEVRAKLENPRAGPE